MSTQSEFDARRAELEAEEAAGAAAESQRIAAREAWIEAFPAWFCTLAVREQIAWMRCGKPELPKGLPWDMESVVLMRAYSALREHFVGASLVNFIRRDHHSTQPDPFAGHLEVVFRDESVVLVERAGHYVPVPFRYREDSWERTFQEFRKGGPRFTCPVKAVAWMRNRVASLQATP